MQTLITRSGLLLLLFSCLFNGKTNAQEGYVKYRQLLNLDSTLYAKDTTGVPAFLYFRSNRSLYVYNRTRDTKTFPSFLERLEQGATELSYVPTDKHGNMFYKDFAEQRLFIRQLVWGRAFLSSEPLPFQNWALLPDSTILLNFHCRKAVTRFRGRIYEAWFCPSIPIRDGPWKFHGLPGLILQVADAQREIIMIAESLQIPAYTGNELQKPAHGRLISFEDLKHIEETETEKLARFLRTAADRGREQIGIDYHLYPIEKEYER